MRWACLATFFLALGLVEFAAGDAWNLLPWATGVGGPAGQSSRRASALVMHAHTCMDRHACVAPQAPFRPRLIRRAVVVIAARHDAGGGTGSARNRREWRLRSMLRHEQQSFAWP